MPTAVALTANAAASSLDRSISRGVHHQLRPGVLHDRGDGGGIGDVERIDIMGDDLGSGGCAGLQGVAELALGADDENLHANTSALSSDTPALSLAESCGSMSASGHAMPIAGSSHFSECSSAGQYVLVHL